MRRVFLGLDLPAGIRSALVVQQFLLPLPRRVEPETMHLTLVFLGEQSDTAIEAAHDGFARLRAAPFALQLQGLGLFGEAKPRAAWAGVAPSLALAALQAATTRASGIAIPHRRFVPHVTLGRFPPPPPDQALRLERAVAEGAAFAAGPWTVGEMVLWESRAAGSGRRYDELARYALS